MPKIDKKERKAQQRQKKLKTLKIEQGLKIIQMYKSAVITFIWMIIFLILSLLFNGGYVPIEFGDSTGANVGEAIIKALPAILFFFFALVSIGNYQEMRGYIATWKELLGLFIITILLATSSAMTFFINLLGIVLVLTYLYFMQAKAEKQ